MTRDPHTAAETTPVSEVAELLDRNRIKRVPVMRQDRVVGIVSRAELMKAILMSAAAEPDQPAPDDLVIRSNLLEELRSQPWATGTAANLAVKDGTVTLWGGVGSESERKATRILAENVKGVRSVDDRRVVIDYPAVAL